MRRIAQRQVKLAFQHRPYRLPVRARRLHGYLPDPPLPQPVVHLQQLPGRGAPRPPFLLRLAAGRPHQCAYHHRLLMHVQPGASFAHYSHPRLLSAAVREDALIVKSLPCALTRLASSAVRCAHRRPGHTRLRAWLCAIVSADPVPVDCRLPPYRDHDTVFIILCAPRRMPTRLDALVSEVPQAST